jgi:hypothetical protein
MTSRLGRYKAPQNFAELVSSAAELRGPRGKESIRVHEAWREPGILMARQGGKYYLVDEGLRSTLAGHVFVAELRAAISSETGIFIWPVRDNDETLKRAADTAVTQWTTVVWTNAEKTYKVDKATHEHSEPEWGDEKINAALDVAIVGRILSDPEDDTVKAILAKKKRAKKSPS